MQYSRIISVTSWRPLPLTICLCYAALRQIVITFKQKKIMRKPCIFIKKKEWTHKKRTHNQRNPSRCILARFSMKGIIMEQNTFSKRSSDTPNKHYHVLPQQSGSYKTHYLTHTLLSKLHTTIFWISLQDDHWLMQTALQTRNESLCQHINITLGGRCV